MITENEASYSRLMLPCHENPANNHINLISIKEFLGYISATYSICIAYVYLCSSSSLSKPQNAVARQTAQK